MTSCIVAQYPWLAISHITASEPPGAIVCTDTRMTKRGGIRVNGDFAKQGRLTTSMHACYTSDNVSATNLALTRVRNNWVAADVGRALKMAHEKYGGFTELIVVVRRKNEAPKILELMPPAYIPGSRTGVIGIGDPKVRQSFRTYFIKEGRANYVPPSAEVLERMTQRFGPMKLVNYRILDAANNVAQALVEAIKQEQPLTVGLPIQLATIEIGGVKWSVIFSSSDSKSWNKESAGPEDVRLPRFPLVYVDPHKGPPRTAEQLD
jgi:hypothetical protein